MRKSDLEHLESLTVEGFEEHKKEVISTYARSHSRNGSVALGINGYGKYCVVYATIAFPYETAKEAIEKYKEFYAEINQ